MSAMTIALMIVVATAVILAVDAILAQLLLLLR